MLFPIDIQYIEQTEQELGIFFPASFKAKMQNLNGGELWTEEDEWILYPFFDRSSPKRMSKTCNHIGLETKTAKEWGNFPPHAIAIGHNGCGDHLILLPEEESSPLLADTIYSWWHETGTIEIVTANIDGLITIDSQLD